MVTYLFQIMPLMKRCNGNCAQPSYILLWCNKQEVWRDKKTTVQSPFVLSRNHARKQLQPIFQTIEDMFELIRAFQHVYYNYPFTLLAFCLMTNPYHILIKPTKDLLSKIMGHIKRCYIDSYAKYYQHIGRIYQNDILRKKQIHERAY